MRPKIIQQIHETSGRKKLKSTRLWIRKEKLAKISPVRGRGSSYGKIVSFLRKNSVVSA